MRDLAERIGDDRLTVRVLMRFGFYESQQFDYLRAYVVARIFILFSGIA